MPAAERRAKVTALESELASDAAASRVQAVVRGRKGRAAAAAMVRARVEAGAVARVQARVRGRNGRAAVAAAADTAATPNGPGGRFHTVRAYPPPASKEPSIEGVWEYAFTEAEILDGLRGLIDAS